MWPNLTAKALIRKSELSLTYTWVENIHIETPPPHSTELESISAD